MAAFLNSGWGRAFTILLVLALVLALAGAVLQGNPGKQPERLKKFSAAVCAAVVIGLAASLRGKQELERPWELPQIGLEQLDDPEMARSVPKEEEQKTNKTIKGGNWS